MTNYTRQDRHYSMEELVNFIKNCSRVYIYGAGKIANKLAAVLADVGEEWDGFLVTDNSDGKNEFLGIRFVV